MWQRTRFERRSGSVLAAVALASLALAFPGRALRAQSSADTYTRDELLEPQSGSFRILYDVSVTTPGAERYFNSVRAGSEVRDVVVVDRASGRELAFEIVGGERARELGHGQARAGGRYIAVELSRPITPETEVVLIRFEPVPAGASLRLR